MLNVILASSIGAAILLLSEILWQKKKIRGEGARKFLHILAGVWTAFWPWLISFEWIAALSIAAIVVVLVSKKYKLFHALDDIKRNSLGDVIVAFGVAFTALVFKDKAIFTIAILHLALADGLAALVGAKYGKSNSYHVPGGTKSVAGSLTFFTISLCLLTGYLFAADIKLSFAYLLLIPLMSAITTLTEAISGDGLDNLTIPLVIAILLVQVF